MNQKMQNNYKHFLIFFIAAFIYFQFLESNIYESTSSVKIKSNEKNFELNILPSFASDSEVYEVVDFLESDEAMKEVIAMTVQKDIGDLFSPNMLDVNKKFWRSDKEWLSSFIDLSVDDSTKILEINTRAYNPETALILNNTLLLLVQYYFDRKQFITNSITSINSLCNFTAQGGNEMLSKEIRLQYPEESNKFNVLTNLYLQRKKECEDTKLKDFFNTNDVVSVPSIISQDQKTRQDQELLELYIQSLNRKNFTSDMVIIVSSPVKNSDYLYKLALFKAFIFAISLGLIFLGIRLFQIIFKD